MLLAIDVGNTETVVGLYETEAGADVTCRRAGRSGP